MRTIPVSTEVFSAIWAARQDGEETEDDVLRRVLGCSPKATETVTASSQKQGIDIPQFGVNFPEGFEIYRTYKGNEFRARVTNGEWFLLNNNRRYPSLHKLSKAVVGGRENSWNNWKYLTPEGRDALIDKLRDPSKIERRV